MVSSVNKELISLEGVTILIVDDDPMIVEILQYVLSDRFRIVTVSSGNIAFDIVAKELPDLILMDVYMSDGDGRSTCRRLKDNNATEHIPVIFFSAMDTAEQENDCWDAGGADFVSKPFNTQTVIRRVLSHLTIKLQRDFLQDQAFKDALTGIYNRHYFNQHIDQAIGVAHREKQPLSVLMLDIDYFKQLNDSLGHLAGDDSLILVAETIQSCLSRSGDWVARYGGEEFVCVLTNTSSDGAVVVAEQIRVAVAALRLPRTKKEGDLLTISLGISVMSDKYLSALELLELADQALYQAKASGRNQYSLASLL